MGERPSALIHIVDDDDGVRDSLQVLLEASGYDVIAFASPQDYLDAKPVPPDCMIVDHLMPGMTGLELIAEIQARGAKFPVIVLTATAERPQKLKVTGVNAIFGKPVRDDILLAAIEAACKR
ncbi:MAG: response regulator [Alphaproteobacteria bacterium]|nr:response regulator [Alphaproteobacteria bacterium]